MAKVVVDDTGPTPGPTPLEALTQVSMAGNVLLLFVRGNW